MTCVASVAWLYCMTYMIFMTCIFSMDWVAQMSWISAKTSIPSMDYLPSVSFIVPIAWAFSMSWFNEVIQVAFIICMYSMTFKGLHDIWNICVLSCLCEPCSLYDHCSPYVLHNLFHWRTSMPQIASVTQQQSMTNSVFITCKSFLDFFVKWP